ncbi:putative S-adenosylmethionine-dependent methyltransferase [Corchorus olitorius]|uniref:S-adenosylmethionine-dependent methyltransferase n=1 Tax=Corchorus olitorius TaxID=93759 RepID=A0A1R3G0Y3_9ROSI|nr:putative S-adenosylmethionine-dependent methyltransferase [Corchorus olitorius]
MLWFSVGVKFMPTALPVTAQGHCRRLFRPLSLSLPPTTFRFSSSTCRCIKSDVTKREQEEEEEETFQVLTALKTPYNDIVIVDTAKSRMLLLDSTHNVHSVLQKGDEKWTDSYWDDFVSLPPIVPEGPIAIYGLGGGTAAHLMLDVWPSLQLEVGIIVSVLDFTSFFLIQVNGETVSVWDNYRREK